MGVFYDVRVHLAENSDDYVGKKGTTVSMGIRKVSGRNGLTTEYPMNYVRRSTHPLI